MYITNKPEDKNNDASHLCASRCSYTYTYVGPLRRHTHRIPHVPCGIVLSLHVSTFSCMHKQKKLIMASAVDFNTHETCSIHG